VQKIANVKSEEVIPVLMVLLNANKRFDAITKTKTVETMLGNLSSEGVIAHLEYLERVYEEEDEGSQIWVIDQMYLLIRTAKVKKEAEWVQRILAFFVDHVFSSEGKVESQLKDKIMSSLGYIPEYLSKIFDMVAEKKSSAEGVGEAQKLVLKIQNRMKGSEQQEKDQMHAILTVVLHIGILAAVNEEHGELLSELDQCFANLFPPSSSLKKAKRKREDEDQPEPVAVLCDILISFLSKPSAVLRNLALNVFKSFSSQISKEVIDLIFEVMNAGNETELFEDQEEAEEDHDSSPSDDESNEEDADIEEEAEVVDEELKAKIQEALANNVEEDLEDLGDEEMEAFDSKLAEIFGQRKAMAKLKKGILF
jgi:DNA polymerase phi